MSKPAEILLREYRPPAYRISDVDLTFDIFESETLVTARLSVQRASQTPLGTPLRLDGERLQLRSLRLNSEPLKDSDYIRDEDSLTILAPLDHFELTITTAVRPAENKSGMGLYQSGETLCTQMEAEGFRRITYFCDRPDIMARYTTTMRADRGRFPVLLSNGDRIHVAELDHNRHEAVFHDPFPKPSYLFALVAGDLGKIESSYTTASGRVVTLRIYAAHAQVGRCGHAMESLKKCMAWDERVYGLEYDLNTFNIVAVDDFNAGAMENKGLNIFNSLFVLADPESATDEDFFNVERVIAHEYFHNWTGNRVTLRDWFQLTLKEGLTVLRDQDFSSDVNSRAVERIRNARIMRDRQFLEDAGPNAHPIRPQAYIEIDNFYTTTVYRKGAEVIGMLRTLMGRETFVSAVKEYLKRFDGQAVTTDDFLGVMAEVSGRDLSQFSLWYQQAGTPKVRVSERYDAAEKRYELTFVQSCAPTPESKEKKPFLIPLAMGLLDANGRDIAPGSQGGTHILELKSVRESFSFEGIERRPVPSLLRDFSAPVALDFDYSEADLCFLLAHDSDPYSRFEAGQRLALSFLKTAVRSIQRGDAIEIAPQISSAIGRLLEDSCADPAFRAQALAMPNLQSLCDSMDIPDFNAALSARRMLLRELAQSNRALFLRHYQEIAAQLGAEYKRDGLSMGKRALKNMCLAYLILNEDREVIELARNQFRGATNMTDRLAAFQALMQINSPVKEEAISTFYSAWKGESMVIDMWINAQLAVPHIDVLPILLKLERDPVVDLQNPNKIQALYGTFAQNLAQFHRPNGEGYELLADRILTIERFNPNIASMLSKAFHWYKRLDPERGQAAKKALERILSVPNLSKGVYEIVQRTLRAR